MNDDDEGFILLLDIWAGFLALVTALLTILCLEAAGFR